MAIISKKEGLFSSDLLVKGIENGDTAALARAITLVESTNAEHALLASEIIEKCLLRKKDSIRIGITGVPGVGKSTFIESFGKLLTGQGMKVAILTVDPTSTLSKGSILGDKTRMEALSRDPNAYIRPSASGASLGGVARKTRESILLCEAGGYEVIIIETVGVGQSEVAVHSMVDFFLLLKLAGAGDELQGIKRGIMEMADAIVINKADGDNLKRAKMAKTEFARALHLYPPKANGWIPKVLTASALKNDGVTETWELIQQFIIQTKSNGHFESKRQDQRKNWFFQTIESELKQRFFTSTQMEKAMGPIIEKIESNQISPYKAAQDLVSQYYSGIK